jgi:hypothetical protein
MLWLLRLPLLHLLCELLVQAQRIVAALTDVTHHPTPPYQAYVLLLQLRVLPLQRVMAGLQLRERVLSVLQLQCHG